MASLKISLKDTIKDIDENAHLVGRVWVPGNPSGPCVVLIKNKEACSSGFSIFCFSSLFR